MVSLYILVWLFNAAMMESHTRLMSGLTMEEYKK